MVTVAGRPILDGWSAYRRWGVRRIFLSVNHLSEVIENHFETGRFGMPYWSTCASSSARTGGPSACLSSPPPEPLLVMNGDLVTQVMSDASSIFTPAARTARHLAAPYAIEVPFGVAEVRNDGLRAP